MAKVDNTDVYGLAESIFRSGYPMRTQPPDRKEFTSTVLDISESIRRGDYENPHIKRAVKLANVKSGGHDQFLTGIIVQFDLTLSNKAWVEAERYTFLDFISSMSTMHRASVLPIYECCNKFVSSSEIDYVTALQKRYNSIDGEQSPELKRDAYLELLYNIPAGFELMAGMTTNYRCLKNIYAQRRCHRLPDWHVVCDWIETLTLGKELICCGAN